MLELLAPDFSLTIEPKARHVEGTGGPYLDWLDCAVHLRIPGFTAETVWSCMPGELDRFKGELEAIKANLAPGSSATLKGVERNFELRLTLTELGGLMGEYQLQNEGAKLMGEFGIDQSYLPEMIQGIGRLMRF